MKGNHSIARSMEGFGKFVLVPIARLLPHEQIEQPRVDKLKLEIEEETAVTEPILVAKDSWVVLNGHHRVEALRQIGAKFVPAWVVNYEDTSVHVEKWSTARVSEDPNKEKIVSRAKEGKLYPPKTSKHTLSKKLPRRRTPLSVLF